MPKENFEPDVLGDLKYIFDNVNNWLNFAELKNGALLVFLTTVIIGLIQFKLPNDGSIVMQVIYVTLMIDVLISIIILLLSFIPKISSIKHKYNANIIYINKNLIFFEDIIKAKDYEEYLINIYEDYYNTKVSKEELNLKEKHLAEEIFINSNIASNKYKHFKYSLYCCLVGIALLIILILMIYII